MRYAKVVCGVFVILISVAAVCCGPGGESMQKCREGCYLPAQVYPQNTGYLPILPILPPKRHSHSL